jgi:hypothetical protein
MFTSIVKKAMVTGLATAALGVGALAPSAAAYTHIGNSTPDAGAQGVSWGSTYCTVNGGDPVVVTVDGVRHVRSTALLSCNAPVHVRAAASGLYTNGTMVTKRIATGPFYNRTSLAVIAQRPCNGSSNRYWTGYGEFELDMNRDGIVDFNVSDASLANLRSCGL